MWSGEWEIKLIPHFPFPTSNRLHAPPAALDRRPDDVRCSVRQGSDPESCEAAPQIPVVSVADESEHIGLDPVEFALPRVLRAVDVTMSEVEQARAEQ